MPIRRRVVDMVRVGEDISEELDIVPAQYFVHRHITASGPPAAARSSSRSRPPRASSTAASRLPALWRTR